MLVAIATPVFTTQLEKSRDAVTVSNLRAAYAEAMTEILSTPGATSATKPVVCKGIKSDANLSGLSGELPFTGAAITTIAGKTAAATVDVNFTLGSDDAVTATIGG